MAPGLLLAQKTSVTPNWLQRWLARNARTAQRGQRGCNLRDRKQVRILAARPIGRSDGWVARRMPHLPWPFKPRLRFPAFESQAGLRKEVWPR